MTNISDIDNINTRNC